MTVALSIPDDLLTSADRVGKRLGVSRSRLYATALADYVARHQGRTVMARLDAVYGTEEGRLGTSVRQAQARSLLRESWWLNEAEPGGPISANLRAPNRDFGDQWSSFKWMPSTPARLSACSGHAVILSWHAWHASGFTTQRPACSLTPRT